MKKSSNWQLAGGLLTLYLVWGSTYLAMRIGVQTWPPFLMAASRFVIAGTIMFGLARWRREQFPNVWAEIRTVLIVGLLLLGIGNGVVAWSEQWVPSGMTALIIASTMLWMVTFEAIRPGGEPFSLSKIAGGLIGMAGVAVLMAPEFDWKLTSDVLIGQFGLLFASIIWAAGSIYSRHAPMPRATFYGVGLQMLTAATFQCLIAALGGEYGRVNATMLAPEPLLAIAYLIVFGSVIGFTTFSWMMRRTSPALTSTYSFVNPMVAIILGALILQESISSHLLGGGALILFSVLILWWERIRSRQPAKEKARTLQEAET